MTNVRCESRSDRAPLPRLHPAAKPAPVNITGLPITKLPPGEAIGARDLQRWHPARLSNLTSAGISAETKTARRKRLRMQRRDENCLTARALKQADH